MPVSAGHQRSGLRRLGKGRREVRMPKTEEAKKKAVTVKID
jgi:hypothetical protein